MGRTHALGGAAALAASSLVLPAGLVPDLGEPALFVASLTLATASALVPDADNDRGSLMNRPYLLPLKLATLPLWWGAPHRGRTHSLVAIAAYTALIVGWTMLIALALRNVFPDLAVPTGLLVTVGVAAAVGYASHLALDLFNLVGMSLFWPGPAKVILPIWQAKKFIPGRFAAGSRWERWGVWPVLAAFTGWWLVESARALAGV